MQINVDELPSSDLENLILEHPDIHTRRWALYRMLHEEKTEGYQDGFHDGKEIYSEQC